MHLWGNEGQSLLHFIHFTYAIGAMLTPLYTEPFIASKNDTAEMRLNVSISTNNSGFINNSGDLLFEPFKQTTNVHYAYLITGCLCFLVAIPFAVLYFTDKSHAISPGNTLSQENTSRNVPFHLHAFMVFLMSFIFLVYSSVEDTFASFLMTFVVSEFENVTKTQGAYINTVFWALFSVGRFGGIFLVKYLRPATMVYLFSSFMTISLSSFLICAYFASIDGLTVFAGIVGFAMAPMFPAVMLWTESHVMKLTSWVSSFIFVGSAVGNMMNPVIVGYLMEEVDNMWYCYLLLAQTLLMIIIFLFLLFFNQCYVNVRYGPVNKHVSVASNVPPSDQTDEFHS